MSLWLHFASKTFILSYYFWIINNNKRIPAKLVILTKQFLNLWFVQVSKHFFRENFVSYRIFATLFFIQSKTCSCLRAWPVKCPSDLVTRAELKTKKQQQINQNVRNGCAVQRDVDNSCFDHLSAYYPSLTFALSPPPLRLACRSVAQGGFVGQFVAVLLSWLRKMTVESFSWFVSSIFAWLIIYNTASDPGSLNERWACANHNECKLKVPIFFDKIRTATKYYESMSSLEKQETHRIFYLTAPRTVLPFCCNVPSVAAPVYSERCSQTVLCRTKSRRQILYLRCTGSGLADAMSSHDSRVDHDPLQTLGLLKTCPPRSRGRSARILPLGE